MNGTLSRFVVVLFVIALPAVSNGATRSVQQAFQNEALDEWSIELWEDGNVNAAIALQKHLRPAKTPSDRYLQMLDHKKNIDWNLLAAELFGASGQLAEAKTHWMRAKSYAPQYIAAVPLGSRSMQNSVKVLVNKELLQRLSYKDFERRSPDDTKLAVSDDSLTLVASKSRLRSAETKNIFVAPSNSSSFVFAVKVTELDAASDGRLELFIQDADNKKISFSVFHAYRRPTVEIEKIDGPGAKVLRRFRADHLHLPLWFGFQKLDRQIQMVHSADGENFLPVGTPYLHTGKEPSSFGFTATSNAPDVKIAVADFVHQPLPSSSHVASTLQLDQKAYFENDEPEILGTVEQLESVRSYCVSSEEVSAADCSGKQSMPRYERLFITKADSPGKKIVHLYGDKFSVLGSFPFVVQEEHSAIFPSKLRSPVKTEIFAYTTQSGFIDYAKLELRHRATGKVVASESTQSHSSVKFEAGRIGTYDIYLVGAKKKEPFATLLGELEIFDMPSKLFVDQTDVRPSEEFRVSAIGLESGSVDLIAQRLEGGKSFRLVSFNSFSGAEVPLVRNVVAPAAAGTYVLSLVARYDEVDSTEVVATSVIRVMTSADPGSHFETQSDSSFDPEIFLEDLKEYLDEANTSYFQNISDFFVAPVAAEEKPLTREDKIKQYLAKLNFEKLEALHKKVEIPPADRLKFYGCLCSEVPHNSSVGVTFMPQSVKASPACEDTSGGPCVVSGFGCWREPFPRKFNSWSYCLGQNKELIAAVDASSKTAKKVPVEKSTMDTPSDDECSKRAYEAYLTKQATQELDAVGWMKSQGQQIMPPPNDQDYAKKLDAIKQLQKTLNGDLKKASLDAKLKLKSGVVLPTLDVIKDNQGAFDTSIDLTLGLLSILKSETRDELKATRQQLEEAKQEAQRSTSDAKKNAALASAVSLREKQEKLLAKQRTLSTDEDSLTSLKKGFSHASAAADSYSAYSDFKNGNTSSGFLKSSKVFQKYLNQYSDYVKDGAEAFENKLLKIGGTDAQAALARSKNASAAEVAEVSSGFGKAMDIAEKAQKAYDIYLEFEKIQRQAERLRETGKFTESAQKMYYALEILGQGTKLASEYFPPGVKEAAQYYAEAVLLPVKLDEKIKTHLDRMDYGANIYGSLQQSPAMRAYAGPPLNRDPYLFRSGGLGVFVDDTSVPHRHYALTSPDREMLSMTKKQFSDLQDLAYYYSLANGKKISNSMLQGLLTSDLELAEGLTFQSIDRLKETAKKKIEHAYQMSKLSQQLGTTTLTPRDISRWKDWQEMLGDYTSSCPLTEKQEKTLFASFVENPEKIRQVLRQRWSITLSRKK